MFAQCFLLYSTSKFPSSFSSSSSSSSSSSFSLSPYLLPFPNPSSSSFLLAKVIADKENHTSKDVQNMFSHIPTDGLEVGKLEKVCCAQPLLNFISPVRKHNDYKKNLFTEHLLCTKCYSQCYVSTVFNIVTL